MRQKQKEERRKQKAAVEAALKSCKPAEGKAAGKPAAAAPASEPAPAPAAPQTPIAFLFPGQGSQALGMLKVPDAPGFFYAHWVQLFKENCS